jgi:hypothetical protein
LQPFPPGPIERNWKRGLFLYIYNYLKTRRKIKARESLGGKSIGFWEG